jgi:hypothetical protein
MKKGSKKEKRRVYDYVGVVNFSATVALSVPATAIVPQVISRATDKHKQNKKSYRGIATAGIPKRLLISLANVTP